MAALTSSLLCGATHTSADIRPGHSRQKYSIKVDPQGVMRRSDTGEEMSWFGTNYTLPFAYAYRFAKRHDIDIKRTIEQDVMHMKRLGFNGFRLHLWDVELSDSVGNLVSNDHLDYLDHLIATLEREGIDIILTAQTNFGNGYPEKDIDTGAFTYLYPKCGIHEDPSAQKAQERYLRQLMEHRNPYTGRRYADDKAIIAVEINNEPCHAPDPKAVTRYIDRMSRALRRGGFDRIILYNVSHNPEVTESYYKAADVQGTTYQWYPTGLVAGHERKGNFMPQVANYEIPWRHTIPEFGSKAQVVYEFDAGDVLSTYLYPAMVRAFRNAGFQWATHFAYDPTPIAAFNTEYQTHYLNLLYTPGKAVGIAIAAEAMRTLPRGNGERVLPTDTIFGDVTLSPARNLAILNTPERYYHTGEVQTLPKSPSTLQHIFGVGSNPMVTYQGSGAYLLDRSLSHPQDGWRLELLPDVNLLKDPFTPRVEGDMVATLSYEPREISLTLPGVDEKVEATLTPGVYRILPDGCVLPLDTPFAGDPAFVTQHGESLLPLYSPVKHDTRTDVTLCSGRWEYDRRYLPSAEWWSHDDAYLYEIPASDKTDEMVWRCNVADITTAYAARGNGGTLEVKAKLPEGAEIVVNLADGTSRFVKAKEYRLTDEYFSIPLDAFMLTDRKLIPQAYPTFLPREIDAKKISVQQGADTDSTAHSITSKDGVAESQMVDTPSLRIGAIESIELRIPIPAGEKAHLQIRTINIQTQL